MTTKVFESSYSGLKVKLFLIFVISHPMHFTLEKGDNGSQIINRFLLS
jgi:hypothetical protein